MNSERYVHLGFMGLRAFGGAAPMHAATGGGVVAGKGA